jgi:hypothetical protein
MCQNDHLAQYSILVNKDYALFGCSLICQLIELIIIFRYDANFPFEIIPASSSKLFVLYQVITIFEVSVGFDFDFQLYLEMNRYRKLHRNDFICNFALVLISRFNYISFYGFGTIYYIKRNFF